MHMRAASTADIKINRALSIIRRYPKPDGPAVNRSCNRSAKGAIQRVGRTLNGRKIGPTELYLQSVNSLRHARNDSAFHIRPIRNPADCRMIDSNTGAGVAGGEATHNKSALGEGINLSVWAN